MRATLSKKRQVLMIFWQVDAFTDTIFKGNPAAVFLFDSAPEKAVMQKIAREMNLSETAFVIANPQLTIRWFTPNSEVDLCGHATLSAAHILWSEGVIDGDEIEFRSRSGRLAVYKAYAGYTLDFPAQPAADKPAYAEQVQDILGYQPVYIGSNGHDCMAVVESTEQVHRFQPDYPKIAALPDRGFLITAQDESEESTYIYRAFFPKLDVPEDPVTGSANTCLAPYWGRQMQTSMMRAEQVSERGGDLYLALFEDRVLITGQAVTVFAGQLQLED